MHDGLQPVSLLQEAASRDPDDTPGPLLTAEKPVAALPVQAPREAAPPAGARSGPRRATGRPDRTDRPARGDRARRGARACGSGRAGAGRAIRCICA